MGWWSSFTGSVGGALEDIGGAVTGAVEDVGGAVGGALEDAGGAVTGALEDVGGAVSNVFQEVTSNPAFPIVAAYFLPIAGAAIGESLVAQGLVSSANATIVGNALASVAVQTAQGVPFEDAVKNAAVSAGVQTGSSSVMAEITAAGADPKVAQAIVSTGGSMAATALKGGSEADILTAGTAGLTGSLVTTATGERILGAAASGAVTGGAAGAAAAAAGAAGSAAARPDTTTTTPTKVSETDTSFQPTMTVSAEAQQVIDQLEGIKPDQLAFVGAASGLGSAAAAETQALLARLAATSAGQAALREAATFSDKVRDAIVASGIFGAAGAAAFLQGASMVPSNPAQPISATNPLIQKIPTTGGDPGTAEVARTTFASTDPRRVDIGGKTQTYLTPEYIGGQKYTTADTPVTADVQRVAEILHTDIQAAAALQSVNRSLFDYLTGGGEPVFKAADPETMRSTDLINISRPGADDNIIIQRDEPLTFTDTVARPATEVMAEQPQPYTIAAVNPAENTALVINSEGITEIVKIPQGMSVEPNTSIKVDPITKTIIDSSTLTRTGTETQTGTQTGTQTVTQPGTGTETSSQTRTEPGAKTDIPTGTGTSTTTKTVDRPTVPGVPGTPGAPKDPSKPKTPDKPVTPGTPYVPPGEPIVPTEPKEPSEPSQPSEPKTPDRTESPFLTTFFDKQKTPLGSVLARESYPVVTTGLTAYRPAGEIESEETGKKRQDVWNEASLRLKDALGL
jgi:hypothetical protein